MLGRWVDHLIDQVSDGPSIILVDWKKHWVADLDLGEHSKLDPSTKKPSNVFHPKWQFYFKSGHFELNIFLSLLEMNYMIHEPTANNWHKCKTPETQHAGHWVAGQMTVFFPSALKLMGPTDMERQNNTISDAELLFHSRAPAWNQSH